MKAIVAGIAVVASLLPAAVMAGPKHGHPGTAKASTMKCPKCGMMMASKPSKAAPARVHVGSHYYYCCTGCGAAGKAAGHSKPKAHKA